jgi:dipeptidyl aminopeptidase/acylaminoacyl peptidase
MDTQKTKKVIRNKALVAVIAALSCLAIYIFACVWSPVTWSPDSSKIALLVTPPGDKPDQFAIFTYDISTSERVLLDEVKKDGVLSAPSWSPDGKWIAYYRVEPSLPEEPAVDLQSDSNTTPTLESLEKSSSEVGMDSMQESGKAKINSIKIFSEENKMLPSFLLDAVENEMNEKKDDKTLDVKLMVVSPNGKERKVLAALQFIGVPSPQEVLQLLMIMQPQWSKDSSRLFYARVLNNALYYIGSLNMETGESCAHLCSSSGTFSLSPDGKWIASLLENKTDEYLLNITGVDGTMQKYFKLDLNIDREQLALGLKVSWSSDSKNILIPAENGFGIINSETGKTQKYSDPKTSQVAYGTFSPIGNKFYYIAVYKANEPNSEEKLALKTFALDNKKTKTITFLPFEVTRPSISPNGKMVLLRGVMKDILGEGKSALILWDGKNQKIVETDRWLRTPFYTNADVIFEKKLIGEWKGEDGTTLVSKGTGGRIYKVIFTEKDGKKHPFAANLVKPNDMMFLALFYSESVLQGDNGNDRLLPDMFMRIGQIEPKLLLKAMEYEDVFELFNKDPNSLKQKAQKTDYDFEGNRVQ